LFAILPNIEVRYAASYTSSIGLRQRLENGLVPNCELWRLDGYERTVNRKTKTLCFSDLRIFAEERCRAATAKQSRNHHA
jgi:hypothetical protein